MERDRRIVPELVGCDLSDLVCGVVATASFSTIDKTETAKLLDPSVGISVRSQLCLDRGGNVVAEVPTGGRMTAWARIYRALKAALPAERYQSNLAVRCVDQDAHAVGAADHRMMMDEG